MVARYIRPEAMVIFTPRAAVSHNARRQAGEMVKSGRNKVSSRSRATRRIIIISFLPAIALPGSPGPDPRSEERRVGKECSYWLSPCRRQHNVRAAHKA